MNKIPFMLVVGEKEAAENMVAVRERGKGDIGALGIAEFAKKVEETIQNDFKQKAIN